MRLGDLNTRLTAAQRERGKDALNQTSTPKRVDVLDSAPRRACATLSDRHAKKTVGVPVAGSGPQQRRINRSAPHALPHRDCIKSRAYRFVGAVRSTRG